MTLTNVLFGSNMDLRALNKIFLYRFLYVSYFDAINISIFELPYFSDHKVHRIIRRSISEWIFFHI